MKYFILVPDGCGDWPIPSLDGKTPLETANIKYINELAKVSETGLVRTIPDGIEPGSDAANLSLLGYDPAIYLSGRAPLEAAAMSIPMSDTDAAFRASLVTLEGDGQYKELTVKDHSAGEIENEDADIFIRYIDEKLGGDGLRFYPGISYRCLLITDKLDVKCKITPPHDILGQTVGGYLPDDDQIRELMVKSYELLKNHPLNIERVKNGKPPVSSIWLWGQGKKMVLPSLAEKYGVSGCMVAAVNLLKGIGCSAGLTCPDIPGATGTLYTNYEGKAAGAVEAFKSGKDLVFTHVEAPDECSHTGDLDGKLKSLELIDQKIFKPVTEYLESSGEPYRVLVLPDHMTPVEIRTHSSEPVPFILFDSQNKLPADETKAFSEACGKQGRFFNSGSDLADYFFRST